MNPELSLILENELLLDSDGWALLAPFGEHRKSRLARTEHGVIEQHFVQVLDNEAADELLAGENTIFRRLKRALVGLPVFRGHPDLAQHSPDTVITNAGGKPDALGVVDALRKSARGIEARFSLLPAGAMAVENEGCKYVSALWMVKPTGEHRELATVVRPYKLLSVGLTPTPNISGVDSLANAKSNQPAATTETSEIMKQLIIGWLAAQGIILANEASDQQVLEACQKLTTDKITNINALGNEKAALDGKAKGLEADKTALANDLATAQTALANATAELATVKTGLAAERKGRSEALVDLAITQGKVAVADRDARIAALANSKDFEADTKALANEAVKFPVGGSKTDGRKAGADTTRTPREQIMALANTDDRYKDLPWDRAYAAILKDHPALAEQLKGKAAA